MADVTTLQLISLLLKLCSDAVTLLMLCHDIECCYHHCFDVAVDVATLVFFVLLTSANVATLITRYCDSNIMLGHSPYDVAHCSPDVATLSWFCRTMLFLLLFY